MTGAGAAAARRRGTVFAIGAAAAFGTNIVSVQIAGQAGLNGPLLVFLRVSVMLAIIGLAAWLWKAPLAVQKGQRPSLLLFGVSTALIGSAYLSSVAFLPVSVAAVVFYTFPILIVLAEPVLTTARFSLDRLLVALVAFIGVALVVGPDFHGLDWRGLALAMLASLAATAQFFAAAGSASTPVLPKLFWTHIVILPVTAAILVITSGFLPLSAVMLAPWAVALSLLSYLIGFLWQVLALMRIAPGAAGLAFCAEPVFAVAIAALVLGERLGPLQYAGGGLVVLAIMTNVILEQKRQAPLPA